MFLEELLQSRLNILAHPRPVPEEFGQRHAPQGRAQCSLATLSHVEDEVTHFLDTLVRVQYPDLGYALCSHCHVVLKQRV